jgi:hypothetical protein
MCRACDKYGETQPKDKFHAFSWRNGIGTASCSCKECISKSRKKSHNKNRNRRNAKKRRDRKKEKEIKETEKKEPELKFTEAEASQEVELCDGIYVFCEDPFGICRYGCNDIVNKDRTLLVQTEVNFKKRTWDNNSGVVSWDRICRKCRERLEAIKLLIHDMNQYAQLFDVDFYRSNK